jgi:hypothetical protein
VIKPCATASHWLVSRGSAMDALLGTFRAADYGGSGR